MDILSFAIDFICCAAELTFRLYFLSLHFSTRKYVFGGGFFLVVWVFLMGLGGDFNVCV